MDCMNTAPLSAFEMLELIDSIGVEIEEITTFRDDDYDNSMHIKRAEEMLNALRGMIVAHVS